MGAGAVPSPRAGLPWPCLRRHVRQHGDSTSVQRPPCRPGLTGRGRRGTSLPGATGSVPPHLASWAGGPEGGRPSLSRRKPTGETRPGPGPATAPCPVPLGSCAVPKAWAPPHTGSDPLLARPNQAWISAVAPSTRRGSRPATLGLLQLVTGPAPTHCRPPPCSRLGPRPSRGTSSLQPRALRRRRVGVRGPGPCPVLPTCMSGQAPPALRGQGSRQGLGGPRHVV